jgi:hypothetical protein
VVNAQTPGFNVRLVDVTGIIPNHYVATDILAGTTQRGSREFDGLSNVRTINFNGLGTPGEFIGGELFPDGVAKNRDDYVLQALASVVIPEGQWSIAFGSDDGGQLALGGGVNFIDTFGTNDPENRGGLNSIWYAGTRDYGFTGGHLSVIGGPAMVTLNSSMFARDGFDGYEIAVRDNADFADSRTVSAANGWQLLSDGVLGWTVNALTKGTIAVGGNELGELPVPARLTEIVYAGGSEDYAAGLAQVWSQTGNPGDRQQILVNQISDPTAIGPFRADSTSWWAGSNGLVDGQSISGVPKYPAPIAGNIFATGNNANNDFYNVRLTGEILFEKDGNYRFRDGVNTYAYLALDTDGSGIAGDAADEVLIDDNEFTGINAAQNIAGQGSSPQVSVQIADAGETGKWVPVEMVMATGAGSDQSVLYWDYNTTTKTPGGNLNFPVPGAAVDLSTAPGLLVPDSHLRSKLEGTVETATLTATLDTNNQYLLQLSSDRLDNDRISVPNPNPAKIKTVLDVTGVTFVIQADGQLVPDDEWVLFDADEVVGLDTVNFVFADPAQWDLSGLTGTSKRLRFGQAGPQLDCNQDGIVDIKDANCLCGTENFDLLLAEIGSLKGDLDGDGQIQFTDFVRLAFAFGKPGSYTDGDIDCDGVVQFADFAFLAINFGKTAGAAAAAVPEPAALCLLLQLLVAGAWRKRR